MVLGENSLYDFWSSQPDLARDLSDAGADFRGPRQVVVHQGRTQSQCGTASNQIGPFYCPLDESVFIDTDFFDLMERRLGAEDGTLAELYVLAHEYGHHVENVYGVLEEAQRDPQGPSSGAVRVELMADCFAGMWIKGATRTTDAEGRPLLTDVTRADVRNARGAAKAVGDDEIQQKSGGGVDPESWTHGSARARQAWLLRGMGAESITVCDTFAAADPTPSEAPGLLSRRGRSARPGPVEPPPAGRSTAGRAGPTGCAWRGHPGGPAGGRRAPARPASGHPPGRGRPPAPVTGAGTRDRPRR